MLKSQREGGIVGLLVGDALGVPYEFHPPGRLPSKEEIDMNPPAGFARSHSKVPAGTWSDDGAQALVLLDSLLTVDELDLDDVAARLVRWATQGHMQIDRVVFDVGNQTARAIANLRAGVRPELAGAADEHGNGNGSLMRVFPLVLWHRGSDEELASLAMRQSIITHAHLRSQLCCALYCVWARFVIRDMPDAWASAAAVVRNMFPIGSPAREELERSIRPDRTEPGDGSGYVAESLHAARWAADQGSFEDAVRAAISLGHDTDTNACLAGAIAGARDGVDCIPARWRRALLGNEILDPILTRLHDRFE